MGAAAGSLASPAAAGVAVAGEGICKVRRKQPGCECWGGGRGVTEARAAAAGEAVAVAVAVAEVPVEAAVNNTTPNND